MSVPSQDTVLIISNKYDEHADAMVEVLDRRGGNIFRLNTEDLPREVVLIWRNDRCTLQYHGRTLDVRAVRSCWFRRPSSAKPHPEIADAGIHTVIEDESAFVLAGLYRCLGHATWVSHPDALVRSRFKPYQLYVARQLGFVVPDTLITNDPETFRQFYEEHSGSVIVKIGGRGPTTIPQNETIYTSRISESDLTGADDIRFMPHLFQAYVEKAYEVRVTIIGDRCFAVRIDSQSREETRIDWRHYEDGWVRCVPMELPTDIEAQCVALVQGFGLSFGAIDLIVRPDGEYVFLEINPNGQWLWIEDVTELPLSAALADVLLGCESATKKGGVDVRVA
ncbi:MAG: MvdC/MvdD family ATP grasp protein [Candidatus Uhrbacteria bacterium]